MNTNTRDLEFVNFNNQEMEWVKFNGMTVYEAWKKLQLSGIPPLTLAKSKNANLVDYKIYGNSVQQLLPSEYQQVEYIESTGTQWIDTGYVQTIDDIKLKFKFAYNNVDETFKDFFGIKKGDNNRNSLLYFYKNKLGFQNDKTNASTISFDFSNTSINDCTAIAQNGVYTMILNGETKSDISYEFSAMNIAYPLFKSNENTTSVNGLKLYNFSIESNGVLMRDFIPCYRKSDNVIGMYDLVNNKFYTNAGTGTFKKGVNVPTPEVPIEVESVGEKSPNLINWDLLLSSANNNPIEKVENGYYGARYSNAYYRDEPLVKYIKSILKPNVTYTLSRIYNGKRDGANGTIFIQDSASTNIIHCRYGEGLVKTTFTLTQEQIDSIDHLYIYFHNNGATISNLQLTEGNTVLPYEPYGYKIPIKVRGKNLFNPNKLTGGDLVKYNGVQCYRYKDTNNNVGSGNFSYEDEFKENTRYTFTTKIYFEDTSKNTSLEFLYTDGTKSTVAISKPGTIYKFTTTSGKTLKQIRGAYMWGIMRYIDLTVTQLEEGTTATEYEPYYEPVTTNIYLNKPLRKVGDKSDYIDFESGKVIRRIKELKLTNVNNKYTWLGKNGVSISNVLDGIYDRPKGLCNRETRFTANGGEKTSIWLGVNTSALYWIGILDYLGFTTLDEMNEWLQNNPTYVYYGSNKTSEETIELPMIPTYKGTNIIEIDTTILPSNMEVIYLGKK